MADPVTAARIALALSDKRTVQRVLLLIAGIIVSGFFLFTVIMTGISAVFLKLLPDLDNPEDDVFVLAVQTIKAEKSISNDLPVMPLKAVDFIMDGELMGGVGEAKRFVLKHFVQTHTETYTVEIPGASPGDPPTTKTRTRTVYNFAPAQDIERLLASAPFQFSTEDISLIMAMYRESAPLPDGELPPMVPDLPVGGGIYSIVAPPASLTRGLHDKGISSGIDIGAASGTPCYAMFDGTVKYYFWKSWDNALVGYGACAFLYSEDGRYKAVYGHLSQFDTEASRAVIASMRTRQAYMPQIQEFQYSISVKQGDIIGRVGNTGYSFGNHLHFGLHIDGKYVDPLMFLQ